MHKQINRVAVLGAGTMGARIAAHLANAGVPCLLLDIVPKEATASSDRAQRNAIATAGLEAAKKSKPAAFFEPSLARLVTVGKRGVFLVPKIPCRSTWTLVNLALSGFCRAPR